MAADLARGQAREIKTLKTKTHIIAYMDGPLPDCQMRTRPLDRVVVIRVPNGALSTPSGPDGQTFTYPFKQWIQPPLKGVRFLLPVSRLHWCT